MGWLDQITGVISVYYSTDAEAISPYHAHKSERADNQDCAGFRIWGCLDQIMGVIWLPHDTGPKVIYYYHMQKS